MKRMVRLFAFRGIVLFGAAVLALVGATRAQAGDDATRREAIEAARSAGEIAEYCFFDADGDGREELLTLDASGTLRLWGGDGGWAKLSSLDTGLTGASLAVTDPQTPIIAVVSDDALLSATLDAGALRIVVLETNLCQVSRSEAYIRFSRRLEGSIDRYAQYAYYAVGLGERPIYVGVDWQKDSYPQPASALDALRRYFEARSYGISDEARLLTADTEVEGFTPQALEALPDAPAPGRIEAEEYCAATDKVFIEVNYDGGGARARAWVAVVDDGGWKVAGAAEAFAPGQPTEWAFDAALACLNREISGEIDEKGGRDTYRVLVPSPGSLTLNWQAGEKAGTADAFRVTLFRDDPYGATVVEYALKPSAALQQSRPIYVGAGTYCVTVEALGKKDHAYRLTLRYEADDDVELESNDTAATATAIRLETAYSASLQVPSDTDVYRFALDGPRAVSVALTTGGEGDGKEAFRVSIHDAADGTPLTELSVAGNARYSDTGSLYLAPGEYLLVVAPGKRWTGVPYAFTVSATDAGQAEAERNDTVETANAIPLNADVLATVGREGDVDCYAFALEGDAVVRLELGFTPLKDNVRDFVLTLLGPEQTAMEKVWLGGREASKTIPPVALKGGEYALRVENEKFAAQAYTLRVDARYVNEAEAEPNDSEALATPLRWDDPTTGVLSAKNDVDCYRLSFDSDAKVVLRFDFPQSATADRAFELNIDQNGKRQWREYVTGEKGLLEQTLGFKAGTYYLSVRVADRWLASVYTLSMRPAAGE